MNAAKHTPDDGAGMFYAAFAYAAWGVMPLYWLLLNSVPPFELTVHRLVWCALVVAGLTFARGRFRHILAIIRQPRLFATLALTSLLISTNWTIYIYCVATHQLVEASLGYYINPFISFAFGALVLGEHMSPFRIAAMALAAVAVAAQALALGHIPWIAPTLALSFGLYGYFRKLAPVDALDGLTVETWVLFPVTLGLLIFWWAKGTGAFPSADFGKDALLLGGGPLTALPLTMFAAGARRIRLTTLGFLQYLSPSITLVVATLLLGEKFTRIDAITFGCVWAALVIVGLEGRVRWYRATRPL
jgi:chloramphenicol-sensitive protein RarD